MPLLAILLVLMFQFHVFAAFAPVGKVEAASALVSAEGAVSSAYQEVLKAKEGGANVSSLFSQLSEAAAFLVNARIAYRLEDYDNATCYAGLCSGIGEIVKNEANRLQVQDYEPTSFVFWTTLTGSLIGMIAVGLGSLLSWWVFKRHYYKRVLEMRPGVSSGES